MRRFTVSLENDTYRRLHRAAAQRTPPATLQQMIRHAVEAMLEDTAPPRPDATAADPGPPSLVAEEDLATFRVGEVWFGVPVAAVDGVAAGLAVVPLPSHRRGMLGVARHRDEVIAVVSAAELLGVEGGGAAQVLVVRHGVAMVGLVVDEVGTLVTARGGRWHPVPPGARSEAAHGPVAVVDTGDRLIAVLPDLYLE